MSYDEKFKQSKQKVYAHSIASKIRTLMGDLRKSSNENTKRRWVWELLQNAKDVAYDDLPIEIEILSTDNQLEFKHNGKPFTVEDITFLVEQVSSKDQSVEDGKKPKKTGKFGTGFLTTHLLSEKVEIDSVIKDEGEPHKKFNLLLDRTGREIDEILESVSISLSCLEDLDEKPPMSSFIRTDLNTSFKYKLSEKGVGVAKIGLNDLYKIIPYVLAFNDKFKSIKIGTFTEEIFELCPDIINESNFISIYTIKKSDFLFDEEIIKIAVLTEGLTSIAIEIEDKAGAISFKDIDASIPRLFLDFPLIGSEDFYFPVIINNSAFSPTEPRDGVDLTDNDDIDITRNKEYIDDAIKLYHKLLLYASDNKWGNLYILARAFKPGNHNWLSVSWFEKNVQGIVREKLTTTPIIELESGDYVRVLDEDEKYSVYFPFAATEEVRERIWELCSRLFPDKMPKRSQIHEWYLVIWPDCFKYNIAELSEDLQNQTNIEGLASAINGTSEDAIEWINAYFDLLNFETKFINEVINNKYSVLPNQNGTFRKRTELFIDRGIDEPLKDILKVLTNDPRDILHHKGVFTASKYTKELEGQILFYPKTQDNIVDEINKILKEGQNNNIDLACNQLTSLFSDDHKFPKTRESLYTFSKTVFSADMPKKRTIKNWNENIWSEVDKLQTKRIVIHVAKSENIGGLSSYLRIDKQSTLEWLDCLISYLVNNDYENLLNLKTAPILPNQSGVFRIKDDLFLDDGKIPDVLKEVAASLGYDFRDELLDTQIFLELPETRTVGRQLVAEKISSLVPPKFAELPRTSETKEAFRKLVIWFNSNKEDAQSIFGELFNSRFKLYDDEEVAASFQKSEQLSRIMSEFGISNLSDLRKALEAGNGNHQPLPDKPKQITQETLVNLGVTSVEELEQALTNVEISSRFFHASIPTPQMFIYAQRLIERAKRNVIAYLMQQPNYDCTDLEILAPTVLGGIRKNNLDVHVVVRPSDHGEVIIYYGSEKDSLDYENAELWIDNGIDDPCCLTLGKILKTTGINRIPVR